MSPTEKKNKLKKINELDILYNSIENIDGAGLSNETLDTAYDISEKLTDELESNNISNIKSLRKKTKDSGKDIDTQINNLEITPDIKDPGMLKSLFTMIKGTTVSIFINKAFSKSLQKISPLAIRISGFLNKLNWKKMAKYSIVAGLCFVMFKILYKPILKLINKYKTKQDLNKSEITIFFEKEMNQISLSDSILESTDKNDIKNQIQQINKMLKDMLHITDDKEDSLIKKIMVILYPFIWILSIGSILWLTLNLVYNKVNNK